MKKNTFFKIFAFLFYTVIFQSCFNFGYVDENHFIGTWEMKGRKIYSHMKIHIVKEDSELKGYIISPPSNNYGQMFVKTDEIWIKEINRCSNYHFEIIEQKIASELLATYGLDANSVFYATFSENKEKIYLTKEKPNRFTQESDIYYERIGRNK
ncbi:MAG TPA: hypothetical protein DEH15_17320 [Marinilabiliales bacterium]|nr:hypothetical protein [Marinilabiliales bacterium]